MKIRIWTRADLELQGCDVSPLSFGLSFSSLTRRVKADSITAPIGLKVDSFNNTYADYISTLKSANVFCFLRHILETFFSSVSKQHFPVNALTIAAKKMMWGQSAVPVNFKVQVSPPLCVETYLRRCSGQWKMIWCTNCTAIIFSLALEFPLVPNSRSNVTCKQNECRQDKQQPEKSENRDRHRFRGVQLDLEALVSSIFKIVSSSSRRLTRIKGD